MKLPCHPETLKGGPVDFSIFGFIIAISQPFLDELKKNTNDKLAEEAEKRDSEVEKLHQGQIRSEKRTKALKERVKKMMMPSAAATAGPDPDEIFEDEDEENE